MESAVDQVRLMLQGYKLSEPEATRLSTVIQQGSKKA